MGQKVLGFFKQDVVLSVSLVLAVLSCFAVPPDAQYIGYINYNTIILLFCLMLLVAGLRELNFFNAAGAILLDRVRTQRGIVLTLVALCFVSSMFITNDVALITFVPLGILILEMAGGAGKLCFAVTLMTIAANLGSMMTPIGNPQNIYLYSLSGYSLPQFLLLMLPYGLLSAVLLAVLCVLGCSAAPVRVRQQHPTVDRRRTIFYLVLFVLCLAAVAGPLPKPVLLVVVSAAVAVVNRGLFKKVDYALLLTFVCFFVFVGNMNRLENFNTLILDIIGGREQAVAIGISQIISNVPAAVLLSGYTDDVRALIIGTNIGGLGTLIASMASLISYKQITTRLPQHRGRYLLTFTLWNVVFLVALCLLAWAL